MPPGTRSRRRARFARVASVLGAGALAVGLPAGASIAVGAGPAHQTTPGSARAGADTVSGHRTAAGNRRAAIRDARSLLRRVALPARATPVAAEPSGDGGVLAHPGSGPPATGALIDRHRWWTVPGRLAAVIAFIRSHPPRGATLLWSGGSAQGPGAPVGQLLGYEWPRVPRVLWSRSLVIAVVDLPGGRSGVRADAQVQWTIPRPADERIPAGVHELDVTRGRPHRAPAVSVHVTSAADIRRLAAMIDSLETIQPGASACPAFPENAPVVTFKFRVSRGGPALATATESAYATEPTTPCNPMTFSVRGRARKPLLGGAAVVRAAGRMLGIRLSVTD